MWTKLKEFLARLFRPAALPKQAATAQVGTDTGWKSYGEWRDERIKQGQSGPKTPFGSS